jgi:hypothetical protein
LWWAGWSLFCFHSRFRLSLLLSACFAGVNRFAVS